MPGDLNLEYIGKLKLRNERRIYKSASDRRQFIVRQIRDNDVTHERKVPKHNVTTLAHHLSKKKVAVTDVDEMVDEGKIPHLNLDYQYGYQRRFELQDILAVLCVLGLAHTEKQGNGFRYYIIH